MILPASGIDGVKARFWEKLRPEKAGAGAKKSVRERPVSLVQCRLCARNCIIADGARGSCGVRENRRGTLYSLVYGKAVSCTVDPIEKKPLFHFLPGTGTLSVATMGCNLHCVFCQNAEISQAPKSGMIFGEELSPEDIVSAAVKLGLKSISYTYTEPTVFYEYAYDTAKLASKKGIKNIFVTNGYIEKKPLEEISPYLDAANVDMKGFSDDFYRKLCLAPGMKPVLETIKRMHGLKIHVELTNLLIPGHNTSPAMIKGLSEWVAKLDKEMPLHFSKFWPMHRLTEREGARPTSTEELEAAYKIAKTAGLKYVYTGNVWDTDRENTLCPACGELLVRRRGNSVLEMRLKEPKSAKRMPECPKCGEKIRIVMG